MTKILTPLALLCSTGCGLREVLPGVPVVNKAELARYSHAAPSPAQYTGPARVNFPVIPIRGFGLQYAVDVVFVSQHPDWSMHEYARLDLPGRSIWIAKDANRAGAQTIVADIEDIDSWMPEIPVPRIQGSLGTVDRSQGREIDIAMSYTNPLGQPTEIWAVGTLPKKPPAKRNGNTMGHSADVVAAILDLERFGSRIKGGISIDGETQRFDRVLGLVPFRFLLQQTQAGIAVSNHRQSPTENGFMLTLPSPAAPEWPTHGQEEWSWDGVTATHDNGVVRARYRFVDRGLAGITILQHGIDSPTFEMQFQPALPDFSRPFEGEETVDFVMHVNGQQGHGRGQLHAQWQGPNEVMLRLEPQAPHWLANRPMLSQIRFVTEGSVDLRTVRTKD
jgi:hypothetical protein